NYSNDFTELFKDAKDGLLKTKLDACYITPRGYYACMKEQVAEEQRYLIVNPDGNATTLARKCEKCQYKRILAE
ncbi:hypothetical protein COU36_03615, partial [Candidatus Micrarchaeota archaeon CG10_big_fil_rev_8_21_14_0_10_59_7]